MKKFRVDKFGQIPLLNQPGTGDKRLTVRSGYVIAIFVVILIVAVFLYR